MSERSDALAAQAAECSRLRRAVARLAVLYDEVAVERDSARCRLVQAREAHEAAVFEADRLREEVERLRGLVRERHLDSIEAIEAARDGEAACRAS